MRYSIAALALLPLASAVVSPQAVAEAEQLQAVAADFYAFALPLVEVARRRVEFLAAHPANTWQHTRTLADHNAREVTTPNNDTVYSHAFLDLTRGPVTLSVPATGQRYLSVALMDMYSSNFAYLGTRATGGKAAQLTLIGPGHPTPIQGNKVVRAPGPFVWALARTLVTGPDDLPAAAAVQDAMTIVGPAGGPASGSVPPRGAKASQFLDAAQRLIAENPPLPADAPAIRRFTAAGLLGPTPPSGEQMGAIATGFERARARFAAARRPGQVVNGWIYPQPNHGEFGTDYAYRAAVAITGLAALGQSEATYLRSAPDTPGNLFDGRRNHRLHFAKGQEPPVAAFWSLSMYERTPDGGFYFVNNPLRRYAIGDRTPGLRRNADGSLDLWIGHSDPGPMRRSNWLPAPAGPFALSLRAYLPQAALRSGRWRAPAVEEVR